MKKFLLNVLTGLLFAALILGGVCIGSVRGWRQEREEAMSTLTRELSAGVAERAMDAANLAVVVARHLPEDDERLIRLRELHGVLSDPTDADGLIRADAELTELALSLGQSLPELSSVQASPRDQAYISALTRTLGEGTGSNEAYLTLVRNFNNRLINSPTGWIARLCGVTTIDMQ